MILGFVSCLMQQVWFAVLAGSGGPTVVLLAFRTRGDSYLLNLGTANRRQDGRKCRLGGLVFDVYETSFTFGIDWASYILGSRRSTQPHPRYTGILPSPIPRNLIQEESADRVRRCGLWGYPRSL